MTGIATHPTASNHQPLPKVSVNPKSIVPDWDTKISKRKWAYYKHVNNGGRHIIYTNWEIMNPPFTHPDFIPTYLKNETIDEYNFRKEEADSARNLKVKGFAVRREAGLKEYEEIDKEVEMQINSAEVDQSVKSQLINDYIQKVVAEENISAAKWEKMKQNLLQTPERVQKNLKIKIFTEDGKHYCVRDRVAKQASGHHEQGGDNKFNTNKNTQRREQQWPNIPTSNRFAPLHTIQSNYNPLPMYNVNIPPPMLGPNSMFNFLPTLPQWHRYE